jgi:hypothetical protein
MRTIIVAALVTLLAVPALAQGTASRQDDPPVFLMSGDPAVGGRVVAVTRLNATVTTTADVGTITHVDLRLGARGYVFAVARAAAEGETVGKTLVTVNGRTRTLAEAAAQLRAGLSGGGTVFVFLKGSKGSRARSMVTAILPGAEAHAGTRIDLYGATHVVILGGGEERSLEIVGSGQTLGSIQVDIGAAGGAGGGVRDLLDAVGL